AFSWRNAIPSYNNVAELRIGGHVSAIAPGQVQAGVSAGWTHQDQVGSRAARSRGKGPPLANLPGPFFLFHPSSVDDPAEVKVFREINEVAERRGSRLVVVRLSLPSVFSLVRRVLAGCNQSLLPTAASRPPITCLRAVSI